MAMNDHNLQVKLFGLGGAGMNIVEAFAKETTLPVECRLLDTDAKAIESVRQGQAHLIGRELCRGLGCGGDVDLAKKAIEGEQNMIREWIEGADVIIVVAALGGGVGSAFAQLLVDLSAQTSAITLGFFVLPFSFEGTRFALGEKLVGKFRPTMHGLFSIPNDYLLQEGEANQTALSGFGRGNRWILNSIGALSDVLFKKGMLHQDLGSLKRIFQARGGKAMFAATEALECFDLKGEAMEAHIETILMHPLLHCEDRPHHLDALLVVIQGSASLELTVIHTIASKIAQALQFKGDVHVAAYVDDSLINSLSVNLFAKSEISKTSVDPSGSKELFSKIDEDASTDKEEASEGREKPKPLTVHRSKLKKNSKVGANNPSDQKEFSFFDTETNRGYFTDTSDKLFKGINLDKPSYLRKGVKIRIK